MKYDLPILAGIYVLLALFAFIITPGIIQTWEAVILFSLTIIYTIFLIFNSSSINDTKSLITVSDLLSSNTSLIG